MAIYEGGLGYEIRALVMAWIDNNKVDYIEVIEQMSEVILCITDRMREYDEEEEKRRRVRIKMRSNK